MPESQPDYRRVRICGSLTCHSDLHVGDGATLAWEDRKGLPQDREAPDLETDPTYHGVCWTPERGPYLPGSSLRGSLRNLLPAHHAFTRRWFGYVETPQEGGGQAGKLRVYDAFLSDPAPFPEHQPPAYWSVARQTAARHAIRIDQITGTAEHKKLFSHEVVPAGSVFRIEFEADDLDRAELAQLLGLLRRWDGGLWSGLGGKRGKGWGRVQWQCERVCGITPAGLADWLAQERLPPEAYFEDLSDLTPTLPPTVQVPPAIGYRLNAEGPLLVSEPGYRRAPLTPQQKKAGEDPPPTHEYSRRPDGTPLIPGKGLVGAVRARAGRIIAGIAHRHLSPGAAPDAATATAARLIDDLFGNAGRRGTLWISDAEPPAPDSERPQDQPRFHDQYFNAIDRFTGAVKGQAGEGALFHVQASTDGSYQGRLLLESHRLPDSDWWKALLLFLARDALEGELAVGWGQAKGYGAVRAAFLIGDQTITTWPELLAWARTAGAGDPGDWIDALHQHIRDTLAAPRATTATLIPGDPADE
ncbi:RAMP superfamily CRISPR-associated protein [uncultured Thiodictyon sp.]|uniref:RAMP superfamily CRISPR-associated protein n=1 Tax=uncultured Thiodictyon sp. TaxID=1846217 RepID=UPI0025D83751|nr:RAMP superfamily CRISPR-associated protein [uncultured Thiodictyon sp.]